MIGDGADMDRESDDLFDEKGMEAKLERADLQGADLQDANLEGAEIDSQTRKKLRKPRRRKSD
jgi:uncharacterized protein YjbI with pentapeptide repeats